MKKKVSDIIINFLLRKKINNVFAVSGGASIHLIHSASKNKKIKCFFNHHEQASAMAADGVAKSTGKPSCVFATSGPGPTNLLTGICCSWFDSTPNIFITGQVTTFRLRGDLKIRQLGFQETDVVPMVSSITKYAVQIKRAEDILFELEKAHHIAITGRKGPVLIDIPDDIQRMYINENNLKKFKIKKNKQSNKNHDLKIKRIKSIIQNSRRPVFVFGAGANINQNKLIIKKFIKKFKIPFLTTWGAKNLENYSDYYCGTFGTHGCRSGNFCIQNADLVISIGTKLGTRETGSPISKWLRQGKIIMIDVDVNEITKFKKLKKKIDFNLVSDSKIFLKKFINQNLIHKKEWNSWLEKNNHWKKKFKFQITCKSNEVDPYYFLNFLSNTINKKTDIFIETGCTIAWFMQIFKCKENQRVFHDFNFTAMGWTLPASIGSSLVNRDRETIAIIGEGSLMMNIQEFATMRKLCKNLKVFIINNNGYSMVKQTEWEWLNSKHFGTSSKDLFFPSFKYLAKANNLDYALIKNKKDINKIKKIINSKNNYICEIIIPPDKIVQPQVKFGYPIEDGFPLISEKTLNEEMIVPALKRP